MLEDCNAVSCGSRPEARPQSISLDVSGFVCSSDKAICTLLYAQSTSVVTAPPQAHKSVTARSSPSCKRMALSVSLNHRRSDSTHSLLFDLEIEDGRLGPGCTSYAVHSLHNLLSPISNVQRQVINAVAVAGCGACRAADSSDHPFNCHPAAWASAAPPVRLVHT